MPAADLSPYLGRSVADLARAVAAALADREHALAGALSDPSSELYGIVVNEVVRAVRSADREELLEGALAVAELLDDAQNEAGSVTIASAEALVQLDVLGDLLDAAASRWDASARPMALRSFAGKAETLLRLLAKATGDNGKPIAVPSGDLRTQLDTSVSNFSHLLGDLSRAALVERIPKGKEVWAKLTERGQAYAIENGLAPPPRPVRQVHAPVRVPSDEYRSVGHDRPSAAMWSR